MLQRILYLLFFVSLASATPSDLPLDDYAKLVVIRSFIRQWLPDNKELDDDSFSITSHEIQLRDTPLKYTAIAGTVPQYFDEKEVVGNVFFTAYLKTSEGEDASRPLTFIFDGGPGGSSLALHISGFGPKRLALPEEGQRIFPPYSIIDNQETLLEESDLIFIDPIGTGFSQTEGDENYKKRFYYSVEGDLESFAEFIRVFCTHFKRWNSPKYLLGASYGTARACGLGETLASKGVYLNGIALMSCAIDLNTVFGERDRPLSECLLIPSLAASAWYHERTMQDKTLKEVIALAKDFCYERYAPAMLWPERLSSTEKRSLYQDLADLIGLPYPTIRRYAGHINEQIFQTEFFASNRKIIGGLDARYVGDISAIGKEIIEDPSYLNIRPALVTSFLHYLRTDLEIKTYAQPYEVFSCEANWNWNWSMYDVFGTPNFLPRLRRTLINNPHMKVFIGSGYYDLRTPFLAAEYSINHLELPDRYRKNFQFEYYRAGHGYIFDLPSLQKMKRDLQKFYKNNA